MSRTSPRKLLSVAAITTGAALSLGCQGASPVARPATSAVEVALAAPEVALAAPEVAPAEVAEPEVPVAVAPAVDPVAVPALVAAPLPNAPPRGGREETVPTRVIQGAEAEDLADGVPIQACKIGNQKGPMYDAGCIERLKAQGQDRT